LEYFLSSLLLIDVYHVYFIYLVVFELRKVVIL